VPLLLFLQPNVICHYYIFQVDSFVNVLVVWSENELHSSILSCLLFLHLRPFYSHPSPHTSSISKSKDLEWTLLAWSSMGLPLVSSAAIPWRVYVRLWSYRISVSIVLTIVISFHLTYRNDLINNDVLYLRSNFIVCRKL
jgi:hypothetical protein